MASTVLPDKSLISCVVFVTNRWLQEAEVKIWSEMLISEACGFMPVAFITCMQRINVLNQLCYMNRYQFIRSKV